ncbi:MAG TPA: M28 family metallopeptidase [Pyrinomonadaceae bacterium]|jgi:N-acetylated-alpha-linked acidic dipeptidase|nr:M28 family metallopeptidase [Pyrinomonadaceae bacterium]
MKQTRRIVVLVVFAVFSFQSIGFAQDRSAIDGFARDASITQRNFEQQFRSVPSPANAREELRRLTSEAHIAGSPEDYATAIYVRDQMRGFGLHSELKEYQVLLPFPRTPSIVELFAPRRERLQVREDVLAQDPTSSSKKIVPLYNGYGASGDVTAPLVYANYGLPNDYDDLKKAGVDVKGKIVIARYGNSFRGVKAKVAEDNGARALLIYSDPADDGYAQGDVYPKGPWRPESSAQRGSVQFLFVHPGDPLTPGTPAIPGTPRIKKEEATNLPHIPVQPISYGDARRLLQPLRGPLRPKGFQGALAFPYHLGGTNDVRVHLKTDIEFVTKTIWNVITTIDGAMEKDRWVVMGNHRDAWVFGAVDPNSGTTAMLEAGRGFGQLIKSGWQPRRTIIMCSWDAEEQGLIGSTEWAEENAAELQQKAIAYLNMDAAVSGPNFGASSVPTLWRLIRGAAQEIRDPKTGKSVYEAWRDRAWENTSESDRYDNNGNEKPVPAPRIGPLGSGSDYTPFLQHLGIPSLDMSFGGDYGVYHSAYDSFYWMSHFGDPTFQYHVAAAQIWGTVAMRLAGAAALPFDYNDYAAELREFVRETKRLANQKKRGDWVDERPLLDAINDLADEAAKIEKRRRDLLDDTTRNATKLQRINDALIQAERALIDGRGLRGRGWYKHQIYAPGFYTGYAALPLPDLRQAIEDGRADDARDAAARIMEAIEGAAEVLKRG